MEKMKKTSRYFKNRHWKSKIANRLKGRAQDICREYLYGAIDPNWAGHTRLKQKS